MMHRIRQHLLTNRYVWLMGVLSYLPLFLTHRGQLNADTKLYLGEDPGGLIARSLFAWDSSQFGGFVPHQAIAYIWPSGPFYWFFDLFGTPQWITQRLWLGTLFFVATSGIFVFLRWLSFSSPASVLAAVVFQFSPYVLAYQSRTSSMLLPWAGLGWLCYFTARGVRTRSWLWPSLIALTMFTVGSVNATATLLILPAPILVALHQLPRQRPLSSLILFSSRVTVLTAGTSLWWISMLAIQGRYGAELLSYSETLESVSSTANAFEVVRGFGYWLNYVGLDSLPLTTSAKKIIASPAALFATVLIPVCAIGALALFRNTHRRLGLWLIVIGMILAIGVYPLENPTPLFSHLASRPTSSLSLAFRSSTRAIPLVVLGISIGIAILIDSPRWRRTSLRRPRGHDDNKHPARQGFIIAAVGAVILLSHPSKFTLGGFEPTLERSPIPESWTTLDRIFATNPQSQSRILQLPGQEFGAHTWGYTVDPVLPAVTHRGLLTRDLIPLGNESMMNLLWAIDEASREGRLHPQAMTTLGRILSVDTILFPGDLDIARYTTTSQNDALSANALSQVVQATSDATDSHKYFSVDGPVGSLIRQQPTSALLLGDGKGLVDAAISGVVGDHTMIYAGHLANTELSERISGFQHIIVTDTNTDKAQHWRTSVDTNGFDENQDGSLSSYTRDSGDIRMNVFSKKRSQDATWFEQIGSVRARASSYGPPLSYRPEHRPFAAIDGNPKTSWTVAHGVTPLAPVLEILTDSPIDSLKLLQPTNSPNRIIRDISISVDGGNWSPYALDEKSLTTGQDIQLLSPGTSVSIRIDTVDITRTPRRGEELAGVGFAEVTTSLGITKEVGILPARGLESISNSTPITYVMSRRVAPLFRAERSDIETSWSRSFFVPAAREFSVQLRVDTTSLSNEERLVIQRTLDSQSHISINGESVPVSTQFDENQQVIIGRSEIINLENGSHLLETSSDSVLIDQVVLQSGDTQENPTTISYPTFTSGLVKKTATLQPCPLGCWIVLGEGHNRGWQATFDKNNIGSPRIVDGGSSGWWLPPFDTEKQITFQFTPQKTLNIALAISAVFVALCLVTTFRTRSQRALAPLQSPNAPVSASITGPGKVVVALLTFVLFSTIFDIPVALGASILIAIVMLSRRHFLASALTFAIFVSAMITSWWEIVSNDPALDFAWTSSTAGSHQTILFTLATMAALSLNHNRPRTSRDHE